MRSLTKNSFNLLMAFSLFAIILGSLSCTKATNNDVLNPPHIAFKTATGYTYNDGTVAASSSPLVGIAAYKTSGSDILTIFQIACSYDGKADSILYTENIYGAASDSYGKDYSVPILGQSGSQKFTFSVFTASGLKSSVSINFNVN